jgi:hypothetical protein
MVIRKGNAAMLRELGGDRKNTHPFAGGRTLGRRALTIEAFATAALAVSLVIAMTAVSIGITRAETFGAIAEHDGAPLAVAVFFGLVMVAMGGLTALVTRVPSSRE